MTAEVATAEVASEAATAENAANQGARLIGCFAARTPLLTPDGAQWVEAFRSGDVLLSRPDDDPEAPVVARRVLRVFQTYAVLLDLHVGGRVIRTTAEHPLWVVGRGWTAAGQIEPGDLLLGADGRQTAVQLVDGPKESAPVYNLEIEEYHTFLIGSPLWGFSVWAHNDNLVCAAAAEGAGAGEGGAAGAVAPKAGAMINGVNVPTLTVSKDAAAMAREAGQVFGKTTQGWSAADKAAFWEALAKQIEAVHSPAWVSVPMKGVNGEYVFSGGSFGVHGLVIFPDGSLGIIGKTVDVAMDLRTALVTVTRRPIP